MNYVFEKTNENIGCFAGLPTIFKSVNSLNLEDKFNDVSIRSTRINYYEIVKAQIVKTCLSLSDYVDINTLNDDSIYRSEMGRIFSPETLRQKLDSLSRQTDILDTIDNINFEFLKKVKFQKEYYNGRWYIPMDCDVTPFINPDVKKEGISRTYKRQDGYAPMMIYLGGYALCFELREGKQHSEKGTVELFEKLFEKMDELNLDYSKILVRVDCAHDDKELINLLIKKGVKFIIKANKRGKDYLDECKYMKKNYTPIIEKNGDKKYRHVEVNPNRKGVDSTSIYAVYELTEKLKGEEDSVLSFFSVDPNSEYYCKEPWIDYNLDIYYTNFNMDYLNKLNNDKISKLCIEAYHDHATSEQYHSEVKTDMDMELLPSKYFSTNELILRISEISYNILRKISYMVVEIDTKIKRNKKKRIKRIRFKSVINWFLRIPCRIVSHAKKMIIRIKNSYSYFNTFIEIFNDI